MRSSEVTPGEQATAAQYNKLRNDASASSWLLAHEQDVADMTLYVESGSVTMDGELIQYAGGNSPTITAPTTHPRIDVLCIASDGTITIVTGTEASSPVAPSVSDFPLCQIYNRVGETKIVDTDDSTNGYVLKDLRVFMEKTSVSFGDGSDGDVTISGTTTLTRDMFYNNLTVNGTLVTDGYRVYVKETLDGTGTIDFGSPNNGTGGINGGTAPGGAETGHGIFRGGRGGHGGTNGNDVGESPTSTHAAGVAGGYGGHGGNSGDNAFAGGVPTASMGQAPNLSRLGMISGVDVSASGVGPYIGSVGGGGGGGGGGGDHSGGGGGGSGGGLVWIAAKIWAGSFTIKSIGGNGGNGNTLGFAAGAGGGGGGGGVAVVLYFVKTWTGSYNLAGGTKGSTNHYHDWADAADGPTGTYYEAQYNTLTL